VQAALAASAFVVAGLWVLARKGDLPMVPFSGVAALAIGVTLLQLVPLPAWMVGLLSPQALDLRTEAAAHAPSFLPLTLDVPATVLAVLRGFTCLAILAISASTTQSRGRSGTFATALVVLGGAIALFAMVHRSLGAEKVFGIFAVAAMPGSGIFGPFVSGNHAASLFMLCGILAIGCARETEGPLRAIVGVAGLLCGVALLSTSSRAGVLAASLGVLAMGAMWLAHRFGRTAGLTAAGGLVLLGIPAALLLARSLRGPRLTAMPSAATELKIRGWRDTLSLIADHPWVGVGRGAFEAPATAYRADPEGVRLVFPENILLQVASEWGVPVALVLVTLFLVTAVKVGRRLARWEPMFQAAACAVLAVLIHELADFGLELPGVALPTAVALGLVAGRIQISRVSGEGPPRTRPGWRVVVPALGVWAAAAAASPWAVQHTLEADGERGAALVNQGAPTARAEIQAAISRHPADYFLEMLASQLHQTPPSSAGLHHLNRAQRLFPQAPAPHALTASYLVALGRRSQAALEYRLAAERGAAFTLTELARAVGFANLERAVPHRPDDLIALGSFLSANGRIREADAATRKAVELAGGSEAVRMQRAKVALETKDLDFRRRTASELAQATDGARALELAAESLASAGDLRGARAVLRRAIQSHPTDGPLVVNAARLLFRDGDNEGARALLVGPSIATFPLAERVQAEHLLAEIATKEGHPELAEAARVRARMLGRLIQSATP
jgi:O-antigen ligase/tetratricopeptide (TPR) repeat protein